MESIPIFIVNFNRLVCLKKLLSWLSWAESKDVTIIDNDSTYDPLLQYYDKIQDHVKIIRLPRNFGRLALWHAGIIQTERIEGPFVYTDPDVVPDPVCPRDLVSHLLNLLYSDGRIQKAGPALRIDNIPETYLFRDDVVNWETRFWRRPVARGAFLADIDTTFALYRGGSPFVMGPALRSGWPYVARHEPWYADSANPTAEDLFYARTANSDTNWTLSELPENLRQMLGGVAQEPPKLLLHLGCGHDKIPGWMNVDISEAVGADLVHDLNACDKNSLPLPDNSVDGFFMSHVFEHIENVLNMMQELYRMARPGANFIIRLPHGASDDAFEDPTHKRIYFPNSFVYFAQPAYSRADYGYHGDWHIKRVVLVVDWNLVNANGYDWVKEQVQTRRNFVREMIVELIAIKPARPRHLHLLQWANPTLSASVIDFETFF